MNWETFWIKLFIRNSHLNVYKCKKKKAYIKTKLIFLFFTFPPLWAFGITFRASMYRSGGVSEPNSFFKMSGPPKTMTHPTIKYFSRVTVFLLISAYVYFTVTRKQNVIHQTSPCTYRIQVDKPCLGEA